MTDEKWTIRGIDQEARDAIDEIHEDTGIPYGRLVSRALWYWIEDLDLDDPVPPLRRAA